MKNLILLVLLSLGMVACNKYKVEHRMEGTWRMAEIKNNGMADWFVVPDTEADVVITEDYITDPWATSYEVLDQGMIKIKIDIIKVRFKGRNKMLWTSNGDSLRFVRK